MIDKEGRQPRKIDNSSPGDFAGDIRLRAFRTQGEVAEYLGLDRSTIGRYESGGITPPIGYLAFLLGRYAEEQIAARGSTPASGNTALEEELLEAINELINDFPGRYPGVRVFRNWKHLCDIADEFERQRRTVGEEPTGRPAEEIRVSEKLQVQQSNVEQEKQKAEEEQVQATGQQKDSLQVKEQPKRPAVAWYWIALAAIVLLAGGALVAFLIPGVISQASLRTPTATSAANSTPAASGFVCGELARPQAPNAFKFLRSQGVINFDATQSDGAILSNRVRSLTIDERGLWIGYFMTEDTPLNGVGHHDKDTWADCRVPRAGSVQSTNINGLAVDSKHRVWAAAEKGGVLMFDGAKWNSYTTTSGLPTIEIFGITVDKNDNVWASTWEGIAKFDGQSWTVPFEEGKGTIFNNHVHFITFQDNGDIWVAHMGQGVSHYSNQDGKWIRHTVDKGELSSGDVYSIAIRKGDESEAESVWFATGEGVSKYQDGKWTTYHTNDGLPGDNTRAVAVDKYNRVWVATSGGVVFLDGTTWVPYHNISALSIAFGPACSDCPFDDDHVWTGTETKGLTHSRLPLPLSEQVIDVVSVRFRKFDAPDAPFEDDIVVAPGEKFVAQIVVSPRQPYTLTNQRGDLLINMEDEDEKRYGAYPQMGLEETIESGQRHTFYDYDNPFVAPQLPDGVDEQKFTTRYRVWMHTRYVGPVIEVTFTVRRPTSTPAPPTEPTAP